MSLKQYRRMRDFRRTKEPRGKDARRRAGGRLSFFIQRHHASRLHYDFRLELDGVLKSWAVPKGPSLDPSARRLAVQVEDHPLEYGSFEGEIPQGQYGGGRVFLWDLGRWVCEGDPREGLRNGRLKFRLEGRKLEGAWMLLRMGGRAGAGGKNWLLIKERDEYARSAAEGEVATLRPESVKNAPEPRHDAAPEPGHDPMPRRVPPQLATLSARVPQGPDWLHEIKYDGYRILAELKDGKALLRTRAGNDWTGSFAPVARALETLRAREAVLDGEVVVLDAKGRSDFQALQNALSEGRKDGLVYYAFDLLFLDGRDLRALPLEERKEALAALLRRAGEGRVRYSSHVDGAGEDFHREACRLSLEGIVSKRRSAPYASRRTDDWLKVKCLQLQEFVVCGFTEPKGARAGFGALSLATRDGGGLVYAGRVGTGFTAASLRELREKLAALAPGGPPKGAAGAAARGVTWVEPALVAEVAFTGWTRDRLLRHPSFRGLRSDKAASGVTRETPREPPRAKTPADSVAGVRITHGDREVFPETGVTKLELARYYDAVADRLLTQTGGRPLALLRCPGGRAKACFFQKHAADLPPAVLRGSEFVYVEDRAGLATLAQFGAIELHQWGSTVEKLELPERLVFDLDPSPGVKWARVAAAAREVRARLTTLGLGAFLKTTGGKGLHVVVPLAPRASWDDAKAFAKAFARLMEEDEPKLYTAALPKAARVGRIFVDYLRNQRGATAVAAWSARAREGATVSTPLSWDELHPRLDPRRFTVRSVLKRLAAKDPWSGFEAARRPLKVTKAGR